MKGWSLICISLFRTFRFPLVFLILEYSGGRIGSLLIEGLLTVYQKVSQKTRRPCHKKPEGLLIKDQKQTRVNFLKDSYSSNSREKSGKSEAWAKQNFRLKIYSAKINLMDSRCKFLLLAKLRIFLGSSFTKANSFLYRGFCTWERRIWYLAMSNLMFIHEEIIKKQSNRVMCDWPDGQKTL